LLILIVVLLILSALLYGPYWLWKRKTEAEIAEGAKYEYQRLVEAKAEIVRNISEQEFHALYHKTEIPRYPGYMIAASISFFLLIPLLLVFLAAGRWAMNKWLDNTVPEEYLNRYIFGKDGISPIARIEPEALHFILNDWAGFYYFFGFLFAWVLVFWFFMKRYHEKTPALLREEIIRLKMQKQESQQASNALGEGERNGKGDDEGNPDRQSA
jgi:uncharacterized protein YneF (UPF0154 family)